jgi:hypothetical protein
MMYLRIVWIAKVVWTSAPILYKFQFVVENAKSNLFWEERFQLKVLVSVHSYGEPVQAFEGPSFRDFSVLIPTLGLLWL